MYAIRSYYVGIGSRLAGHMVSRPIVNPLTGEIIADAGDKLSYDDAMQIETAGVYEAFVTVVKKETVTLPTGETTTKVVITSYSIHYTKLYDVRGRLGQQARGQEAADDSSDGGTMAPPLRH